MENKTIDVVISDGQTVEMQIPAHATEEEVQTLIRQNPAVRLATEQRIASLELELAQIDAALEGKHYYPH